jgi:hypothetical protein
MSTETKSLAVISGAKVPAVKPPLTRNQVIYAAAMAVWEDEKKQHAEARKTWDEANNALRKEFRKQVLLKRSDADTSVLTEWSDWNGGKVTVTLSRKLTPEDKEKINEATSLRPKAVRDFKEILKELQSATAAPDRVAEVLADTTMKAEFLKLGKALLARPTEADKAKAIEA